MADKITDLLRLVAKVEAIPNREEKNQAILFTPQSLERCCAGLCSHQQVGAGRECEVQGQPGLQ